MLGVVGLVVVDVYALQIFFLTVAIAVLLGFLHGLLLLPTLIRRTAHIQSAKLEGKIFE